MYRLNTWRYSGRNVRGKVVSSVLIFVPSFLIFWSLILYIRSATKYVNNYHLPHPVLISLARFLHRKINIMVFVSSWSRVANHFSSKLSHVWTTVAVINDWLTVSKYIGLVACTHVFRFLWYFRSASTVPFNFAPLHFRWTENFLWRTVDYSACLLVCFVRQNLEEIIVPLFSRNQRVHAATNRHQRKCSSVV